MISNVQHITQFFTRNWQKMAKPSLRPVEGNKERFNLAQSVIHRNLANHLPAEL